MTWGAVETTNMTDAKMAADQQAERDRAQRRGQWHATGREALGYRQNRDGVWVLSGHEQTQGYPPALITNARAACSAEVMTHAKLEAAHNQAMAYITKHQLSAEAARVHLELARAETWTAYHEAARDAERECAKLGEAVESIKELRAIINNGPVQDAQIDAWAKARHDQVAQQVEGARARLAYWGVT